MAIDEAGERGGQVRERIDGIELAYPCSALGLSQHTYVQLCNQKNMPYAARQWCTFRLE